MEQRYNIYFAGQVLDGFDVGAVRDQLAKVFNANQATLDKLFSGTPQLIKRDCDAATAAKYKQAIERAGAIPIIKLLEAATASSAQAAGTSTVAAPHREPARAMTAAEKIAALAAAPDEARYTGDTAQIPAGGTQEEPVADTGGIALAPPGTAVLREEERAEFIAREVDTSGLAIDTAAERLSQEAPPPPAAPDTRHLSMGEVGEAIPNLDVSVAPLSPNLDGLALSAAGTDFSDCALSQPLATPLDLSHLAALAPGDIPLAEQHRRPIPVATPSIDHISLQD